MGQIQKQAIKGTIYTYFGIAIGFLTSGLLFPRFFSPEQVGLVNVLVSYAVITAQFASLGFNGITNRFFPYFRNIEKKHFGFLTLGVTVVGIGFVISSIVLWILNNADLLSTAKSPMLRDYFYFVYILVFIILFFTFFDNYAKVMYNAVIGTFLKEFVQRLGILTVMLIFIFGVISFSYFVDGYVLAYAIPLFLLLWYLWRQGWLVFAKVSIPQELSAREMISMSLFFIISGLAGVLTVNIDRIMVQNYLGLHDAGIYTVMFFFGTMVSIPSRSLMKISSTFIADAWKDNDIETIDMIYRKSIINQTIIGSFIFVILIANIENIFGLVGDKYYSGKMVVFWIGLAYLIDMAIGVANSVIGTSREYKKITYIIIIQGVLVVVTNVVFIHLFGLIGAAIGSLVSKGISDLLKVGLIKMKFNLFPYDYKFVLILLFAAISFFVVYFYSFDNWWLNIMWKTILPSIIFVFLIDRFHISEEFSIKNVLRWFGLGR